MAIFRLRSTTTRPSDATAYAAGDEISNSATAGSVVRPTFNLAGFTEGRFVSAELDILAASGNVVTTALDLELLLFRTGEVPAAVGDNVTQPLAAATRAQALACFHFDDTGWVGPLGTVAAGTSQYQSVAAHYTQPDATPVLHYPHPPGFLFSLADVTVKTLTAVLRARAAWTPSTVVNTIGITLNFEAR